MSDRGMKMIQDWLAIAGSERATYLVRFQTSTRRVTAAFPVSVSTMTDVRGRALLCEHNGYPFSTDEVEAVEFDEL